MRAKPRTFAFFLDAFRFCRQAGLPRRAIKRVSVHQYVVKGV